MVSDLSGFLCRRVGSSRIQHRVKKNWLRMVDKAGLVLRIGRGYQPPEEFRERRQILRDGTQHAG